MIWCQKSHCDHEFNACTKSTEHCLLLISSIFCSLLFLTVPSPVPGTNQPFWDCLFCILPCNVFGERFFLTLTFRKSRSEAHYLFEPLCQGKPIRSSDMKMKLLKDFFAILSIKIKVTARWISPLSPMHYAQQVDSGMRMNFHLILYSFFLFI